VVAVGLTFAEPLVTLLVLKPEPVQEVALVELHFRAEVCPTVMLLGVAVRETVGAGLATVTVALAEAEPPAPAQVTE